VIESDFEDDDELWNEILIEKYGVFWTEKKDGKLPLWTDIENVPTEIEINEKIIEIFCRNGYGISCGFVYRFGEEPEEVKKFERIEREKREAQEELGEDRFESVLPLFASPDLNRFQKAFESAIFENPEIFETFLNHKS